MADIWKELNMEFLALTSLSKQCKLREYGKEEYCKVTQGMRHRLSSICRSHYFYSEKTCNLITWCSAMFWFSFSCGDSLCYMWKWCWCLTSCTGLEGKAFVYITSGLCCLILRQSALDNSCAAVNISHPCATKTTLLVMQGVIPPVCFSSPAKSF